MSTNAPVGGYAPASGVVSVGAAAVAITAISKAVIQILDFSIVTILAIYANQAGLTGPSLSNPCRQAQAGRELQ
jgi:uncharacterized protein (DUF362 family)